MRENLVKKCLVCDKEFVPIKMRQKYCKECSKHYKPKHKLRCLVA